MARRLLLALVPLALVASACPSGGDGGFFALDPDEPRELELRLELAASLETFDDCGQVLDYFRESASDMGAEQFLWGAVADGDEGVVRVAPLAGGNGGRVILDRGVAAVQESADAVTGLAPDGGAAGPGAAGGGDSAATVPAQTDPGPAYSETNVQEAGIDEPDVVKTDGRLVVALAQGRLVTVDPSGGGARVLGSVEAPEGAAELFLHGDRAVVLGRSWRQVEPDTGGDDGNGGGGGDAGVEVLPRSLAIAPAGTALTTVSAVDLSDPANPAVTRTVTFEGDYVTARLHEGVVRLVLRSTPTFEPLPLPTEPDGGPGGVEPGIEPGPEPGVEPGIEPGPEPGIEPGFGPGGIEPGLEPGGILPGGIDPDDEVRIMAERAVAESTLETWLPDQVVEGPQGEQSTDELVACDAVARPPEPSGVGTVTVLTIDAAGSLDPLDTDSVVADAQTVYASSETLYVATNQWREPTDAARAEGALTTELHAFDIAAPDRTEYLSSGRVRGQLLNQWSLSEHAGHLRVATTDGSPWAGGEDGGASESFLTVLRREGDGLDMVGQVGGMGRGERIYAVRYFGDLGFVVTFREIDPLYALDLSDPANPRVAGELKIPGFSSYLHPVATGRLLGVGQDATDQGQTLGTQVSLFDVADVEQMDRLDHEVVPNAHSPVEHDHRAFLWWGPSGLAVLPLEVWQHDVVRPGAEGSPTPSEPFLGAAAFRIEGDRVEPAGRVTHAGRVEPQSGQTEPLRGQVAPPSPGVAEDVPVDGGDALADDIAAAEYVMPPTITRAFVVGDTLYTLSEAGILASDLATMDDRGWAAF